jgi:hypothetical protein
VPIVKETPSRFTNALMEIKNQEKWERELKFACERRGANRLAGASQLALARVRIKAAPVQIT